MSYDFETLVPRRGQGSNKWNAMYEADPTVGDDIVPFSIADMEFANAPEIAAGVGEYLSRTVLGYASPTDSYLAAVCGWMGRRHGWRVEPEWIVDYPGVVPALFHLARLLAAPGEGIILMTPVYYPFYDAVRKGGRTICECPLVERGGRYEIDFEALERACANPRNRALFLCSPHNPVGRVWSRDELERVAKICLAHDVVVVSDEIHADLVMPGHIHVPFACVSEEAAQSCIVCTAPSKTFNTAGLMTSNLVIPNADLRERVRAFRTDQAIFSCNTAGYAACEVAYTKCEGWLDELLVVLERNRQLVECFVAERLPQLRVVPLEGTYLQWIDCRGLGLSADELERFMVGEARLFLDEGKVFGKVGEGFERLNIACPTWVLESALERLAAAVERRGL